VPVDPERHALEMRIEHAKQRILEDFDRASTLVRQAARRTGRGLGTLVVASAVLVAGAVAAALLRRRRRRLRVTWR
jgi:hypothetical protein